MSYPSVADYGQWLVDSGLLPALPEEGSPTEDKLSRGLTASIDRWKTAVLWDPYLFDDTLVTRTLNYYIHPGKTINPNFGFKELAWMKVNDVEVDLTDVVYPQTDRTSGLIFGFKVPFSLDATDVKLEIRAKFGRVLEIPTHVKEALYSDAWAAQRQAVLMADPTLSSWKQGPVSKTYGAPAGVVSSLAGLSLRSFDAVIGKEKYKTVW